MSASEEDTSRAEPPLLCADDLASDIEAVMGGSPHAPEILARLFLNFRQAIESGLRGIQQTSDMLLTAVELIYLRSEAHAAALRLFLLSQQGELKFEDEPLNIISAAIGRSTAAKREASKRGRNRIRK